jgi:hypothetical protein
MLPRGRRHCQSSWWVFVPGPRPGATPTRACVVRCSFSPAPAAHWQHHGGAPNLLPLNQNRPLPCLRFQAIAQLYGYLLGQDQQTRFTVFAAVSVGCLVYLPQHNEKAKSAREKLRRSTEHATASPAAAASAAAPTAAPKKKAGARVSPWPARTCHSCSDLGCAARTPREQGKRAGRSTECL